MPLLIIQLITEKRKDTFHIKNKDTRTKQIISKRNNGGKKEEHALPPKRGSSTEL